MNIERILEKASKYNHTVDSNKYGKLISWIKEVKEINIETDRENMILLMELEKEVDESEIKWLKLHYNQLNFDTEFVDKGFAFVDVMTITNKENETIATFNFYGDGESQEFIEMLIA